MTTTAAAIRDSLATRVAAVTPSAQTGTPFRQHREQEPIRDWAAANPTACLRWFSVRWVGDVAPPVVTNTTEEQVERDIEVVVAYPTSWRFGDLGLVDLEEVIAADARKIDHAVGTNGYADIAAATSSSATVISIGESTDLGPVVSFGIVRLRVLYTRSPSA